MPGRSITAEDVQRYLAAKKADGRCCACGTESWTLPTTENGAGQNIALLSSLTSGGTDLSYRDLSRYIGTIPLYSANCGLYRLFDREAIENWLNSQPNDG